MVFSQLERWYGKRVVYGVAGLLVVLVAVAVYFTLFRKGEEAETEVAAKKQVTVRKAGDLESENASLPSVGTVRAVSEARLETEASGRVTAVNVAIGDRVSAGTVLASIENSRERAALLQAEGAYESAQAGSAQASIGLKEAEVGAQNANRSAHTVGDDAIHNLADELFSNPDSSTPGIRLDAKGAAVRLNNERVAIGDMLDLWHNETQNMTGDPLDTINDAEEALTRISNFVNDLSLLVSDQDANAVFTPEVLAGYKSRFLMTRSSIDGSLSALSGARNALLTARENAEGGNTTSESEAREKQALGSLRLAQAAYEKTLVRSPISGTVNAMYLKANEYVGAGAQAAVVANNNALEVTTSIGEDERSLIAVGGEVAINDTYKGTVTKIAPAIDPATGKIEVKISVDENAEKTLANGATVSLAIKGAAQSTATGTELRLPLQAVKITPQGPSVFTLEGDTLKNTPIVLGPILGEVVVVESGIDADTAIVTDVRGLKDGEAVEVTQ